MDKERIKDYKDDIVKDLAALVAYPSVYSEDEPPFGKQNKLCLHEALSIAESYGFKTVNVDDYCGYIEMGQGDEIIGVLAHLDVVPVSKESWKTDPFVLTEIDGKYYGRGTSDDKGAVIASLTAMRMLKEKEPTFNKRVRLILGCNEESGSRGVAHYVEKYGYVDCGFTPDGAFPLVFGEKGMVSGLFSGTSNKIADIKGGTVSNAVASRVDIKLNNTNINEEKLDAFFKENNIKYQLENNTLTVFGNAAHASTPQLGVNAISFAMEGLYVAGINDDLVDAYHNLISTTYDGSKLGINFVDEYGSLTFNIGLAFKKDDKICFTIDIRFPVTMKKENIIEPMKQNGGEWISNLDGIDPLFFSPDHPMIKALENAYIEVTGDTNKKPMTMGGGTYAKEMNNIVAFGCDDEEYDYHIHDDDEFVTMESLLNQVACYYQAIINLMEI